uniref:Putative ribonuclease H-like domain-containing protein n=1 Tax=Tanacetum cinerariifolium TaxID=118510 RepID=A0A6L2J9E1_TANCI|nr:putative ribonuclease H-like domain-containing protein [Tanacetum cinerariifolium]
MYNVNLKNIVPSGDLTCLFAKATINESNLWHRRLGHINFKTINKLVKGNLVRGLPIKVLENDNTCVACKKGEQHRASCKTKPVSSINQPLFRLHIDLFGPTFIKSLNKKRYCFVITDDYSRFTWVFFLATKNETSPILKTFITGLENQLSLKVKGIKREFSILKTPQQNGIAKRKNKTLIKAARTMVADSLLPISFWAKAVNTACYVQNRVLVTKPHNKTPYELLHGRTPSIGFMRPFGCLVTILNTLDPLGKFQRKVDEGFLVGYFVCSKAFRVFNSRTRIIQETLHVNFLENKPNVAGFQDKFDAEKAREEVDQTYMLFPVLSAGFTNPHNNDEDAAFDGKGHDFDATKPESVVIFSSSSGAQSRKQDDKTKKEVKGNSPVESFTGYRDLNAEFEHCSDNSSNEVNVVGSIVPTVGQNTLNNTNTFSVVGPSNTTVSPTYGKSSSIDASQLPDDPDMPELDDITYSDDEDVVGVEADFNNLESSIPVSPILTTRIHKDHPVSQIIGDMSSTTQTRTYASFMGFMVYQMDVKSVFLYGTIKEEVYVCQPPGFQDPDHPDKVYKVVKPLYGLHQAPRAWYKTLATYLLENGFQRAEILRKFGLTEGKSASTPNDIEKPLLKDPDGEDVDVHTYRSMIGSLMYLTSSRPDIMFAVCTCTDDVTRLQALVDRKKIVITEAAIRDVLRLDDAEGVDCLPNEDIFAELAHMGYEKPSTKLTFYKAFFSSHWKFLIHTILQSMCAKRTLWNEFSSAMASAVIYLSTGRRFNFSKYIFESLVRNVDSTSKFYMYPRFIQLLIKNQLGDLSTYTTKYTSPALTQKVFTNMRRVGKGFLGVETPLFEGMLVAYVIKEEGDAEEQVQDVVNDYVAQGADNVVQGDYAHEPSIPSPTLPTPPPQQSQDLPSTSQEALDACVALTKRVEHLKYDKVAQSLEITKLKRRVKKLEKGNRVKVLKLRSTTISAAEPQVPAAVITTDALVKVAAAFTIRRKGVVIRDPEEESTTIILADTKSKDKGKGIMVEEPKPLKKKQQVKIDEEYERKLHEELNKDIDWDVAIKHVKQKAKEDPAMQRYRVMKKRPQTEAQARKNMIMYLKNIIGFILDYFKGVSNDDIRPIFESINETPAQKAAKKRKLNEEVEDLKRYFEIMPDEDDDFYTEATLLARKVPVVDYEIIHLNNKPHYKIIRADGTHQLYVSFLTLLKNFDREDLESLWSLVKERFYTSKPNNFSGDFLLTNPGAMFKRPDGQAQILLVERRYLLSRFTLDQMLNAVRLKVEEQSEMSLELLRFTRQQHQEGQLE